MKAEASRSIKKCAYCSRVVEDPDGYTDLAPSGPVVYRAPAPGRSLPVLQVVCEDCRAERARFALGDFGRATTTPAAGPALALQEVRAGF